jgi:3-methyladenine DNA glycosylase Tag
MLEINQAGLSWLTILKKRRHSGTRTAGSTPKSSRRMARETDGGCWPTPASSAIG